MVKKPKKIYDNTPSTKFKTNNLKNRDLRRINKHINFDLEGTKSNSRKSDTRLTCVECGVKFNLPFKPRDPEVYCEDCFKAKNVKGKKKKKSDYK